MSDTNIAWAEKVWNFAVGCDAVSAGCKNCYAAEVSLQPRMAHLPQYQGVARQAENGRAIFTGRVNIVEAKLNDPLHWRKPCRVFVNSMSDFFHPAITDEVRDRAFAVMALCPQHQFLILTKRPEKMLEYVQCASPRIDDLTWNKCELFTWPLSNVWLGVSVEDQKTADERIPILLQTPAAVRWVSAEPLLAPVLLGIPCTENWLAGWEIRPSWPTGEPDQCQTEKIDWVVVGAESGANRRPCEVEWIESIVEQCKAAEVACFVKQDSSFKPGKQGRLSDRVWSIKEYPK